ncbi:adhesion G-protein coupled receptor D1-like [Tigriopus californicus]|uniref:adhesion G-protein coupled receptor D1-like n=1 Tax=Tigriopus californicus TaxID=6832 RepID=UPI0027DA7C2F|nr:adhesion G-protein coupled receptor D1-like [Tigriopus californicus]
MERVARLKAIVFLCLITRHSVSTEQFMKYSVIESTGKNCPSRDSCRQTRSTRGPIEVDWKKRNCFCDNFCSMYGDCCIDAPAFNSEEQRANKKNFDCVNLKQYGDIYIRSQCPSDWEHSNIQRACENPNEVSDPFGTTPVTNSETGATYRNFYCAVCNADSKSIQFWKPRLECPTLTGYFNRFKNVTIQFIYERLEFDENRSQWGVSIDTGGIQVFHACFIDPSAPEELLAKIRTCPGSNTIMDCPTNFEGDVTRELCLSYTGLIFEPNAVYRNVHCALCNGANLERLICLNLGPFGRVNWQQNFNLNSFAVLFDLGGATKNSVGFTGVQCQSGKIFDPFFKKCRSVVCPNENELFIDGSCIDPNAIDVVDADEAVIEILGDSKEENIIVSTIKATVSSSTSTTSPTPGTTSIKSEVPSSSQPTFEIPVFSTSFDSVYFPVEVNTSPSRKSSKPPDLSTTRTPTTTTTIIEDTTTTLSPTDLPTTTTTTTTTSTTFISSELPSPITTATTTPTTTFVNLTEVTEAPIIPYPDANVSIHPTANSSYSSPVLNVNDDLMNDTTLHDADSPILFPNAPSTLSALNFTYEIKSTSTTEALNETVKSTSAPEPVNNPSLPTLSPTQMLFLQCPKIQLQWDEYQMLDNGTIFVEEYNLTLDKVEYQFVMSNDEEGSYRNIWICVIDAPVTQPNKFDVEMGIVTMIGLGLSTICLVFHLIAFTMAPELQNLSGKNLASMSIALLGGYLSFISAMFMKNRSGSVGCFILAVFMYYFFLSAFLWMFVVSWDIFHTLRLATTQLRLSIGKQWKKFGLYCVIAWGIPTLLAAVAVIADLTAGESMGFNPAFGQSDLCWFSNKQGLLAFFAIPIGLLLISNIVFFVLSAGMVYDTTSGTNKATSCGPSINFHLYLKLAIIMGLTWIIGLVAGFLNVTEVWYVFIALNTLQGVFIFVAFSCNRKVFQSVRSTLRGDQPTATSSFSSMLSAKHKRSNDSNADHLESNPKKGRTRPDFTVRGKTMYTVSNYQVNQSLNQNSFDGRYF